MAKHITLEHLDDAKEYIDQQDNLKVDKVTGKGLSTNDYDNTEKGKVASAVQPSDLSAVATSGSYNDLNNKPTIPTVPTTLSSFTNDVGFITNTVSNLTNYYLKTEAYTKTEVNNLIGQIEKVTIAVVSSLPTTGEPNKIYLVPSQSSATGNVKDEYIWVSNAWELIGSTRVDLSNYYTKTETDTLLSGKASSSDLTSHTGNTTNPHSVTKAQVGLGNVPNTDFTTPVANATSHIADSTIHVTSSDKTNWNNKGTYSKPSGGIPATDLSSDVQTSLGKADTAIQAHQTLKTINNQSIVGSGNITVSADTSNCVKKTGESAQTIAGNITVSGSMSASSFNATSLRAKKENIAPYGGNALVIVNSVDVVSFNYKDDEEKNYKVGFIADDTHSILSTKNHNQMDVTNCIGILLKAVQELSAEVERLKSGE